MDKKEKEILKLKKLLIHWAEHNDSHMESFVKWRNIASSYGLVKIVEQLDEAIGKMKQCNEHLLAAHTELT